MAHEFDTGFSVRKPMWHGLGTVINEYPESWDEARRIAGLLWEPKEVPLYVPTSDGEGYREVEAHKAIVRDDNHLVLGTVGKDYRLVSHAEMGEIVEVLLDQPNVKFETAGSVREGRNVWVLAKLDEPFQVPGDPSLTLPYFAFLNSHDGTGALKVLYVDIRIVCWNTFSAANIQGDRTGAQFSFRHTTNIRDKIEDAKKALQGLRDETREWLAIAESLSLLKITSTQRELFIREFIPAPPEGLISDRVRNNIEEARGALRSILNDSPTTEGIRGSAYGLVQAAGEYLDHVRRYRSTDTYLGRTLLRPEPLKAKAAQLAREVAVS